VTVVVCSFTGWVQVRLATNPDPTDEPRGVSGYTFALPGEPDLDRIVRTSCPVAPRSHGPAIGLIVGAVAVDGVAVAAHPLVGARIDWLGAPRFESVNEIMMEQGEEPLAPFDVALTHGAFRLRRAALLDPARPEATVYDVSRAQLEPWRASVTLGDEILREATGGADPVAFRVARRTLLEADLARTTDPVARAGLARRISELRNVDPDDHRTASMRFIERRHYALDGAVERVDPDGWLPGLDTFAPFACDVVMGAWDADALSAYATGTLTLPCH
jgi:hypothetical protein